MKILAISGQVIPTPPKDYGGLEWVVYNFCAGLAKAGEEVTMVCLKGSKAPPGVELLEINQTGSFIAAEEYAFRFYKHLLPNYDVVLDHSWTKWSYTVGDYLPVIGTLHTEKPYSLKPPKKYPCMVGVSRQHSLRASKIYGIPFRTAFNPVDMEQYKYSNHKGEGLLSVNRVAPEKGINVFVDWVSRTGMAGTVIGDDRQIINNPTYPAQVKKSCENTKINYKGLVSNEEKMKLLHDCRAVVLLPQPPYFEVFGLAAVEGMACGKPIICTPNGGLQDIVVNGETGFFVDTYEKFETAVKMLDTISPEACRKRAEKFSIENTTPVYHNMIKRVSEGCRW